MHTLDWLIVFGMFGSLVVVAQIVQRYTVGVSDFLAANRTAGRYLLSVADGAATLAAVTILGNFEMYYRAGFTPVWWAMMTLPVGLIGVISGWCVYRFRETRAMTLAQFFEIRYNKSFRIFAGALCFISGIINFGIFPAVCARFFIYYCGLPPAISVMGIEISMFALMMIVLLVSSLYFAISGGQITVIITDFMQGSFMSFVFVLIIVVLMWKFDWTQIIETLKAAPQDQSLIDPLKTSKIDDFNVWFFVIQTLGYFYWRLSWQGNQAYNSSARSPHDSKMSRMLASWRESASSFVMFLVPICAYVVLNHADFSDIATRVNASLDTISTNPQDQLRFQMTVPVTLSRILPMGMVGAFCAAMLAAVISAFDTLLHSWGSILVQDVILPFRKTPLAPKQHLLLLRVSVAVVAVFVFFWGLLFKQQQHILMYTAVTGAVFLGGAGAAIVGGLYWKKGSTAGAWAGMIVGAVVAIILFVLQQLWPVWHDGIKFPIHGQYALGLSMLSGLSSYLVVSLLGKTNFNIDRMLHRGQYAIDGDQHTPETGWRAMAITKEFSVSDKVVYIATLVWCIGWWVFFVGFTVFNLVYTVKLDTWIAFWRFRVWLALVLAVVCFVWFFSFGLKDLIAMWKALKVAKHNALDSGMVVNHHNTEEANLKN